MWGRLSAAIACVVTVTTVAVIPGARAEGSHERLGDAIDILDHVPAGHKLVTRGLEFWKLGEARDLSKALRWGDASRTDSVLTRYFNPRTGREHRDRQVTIYLREGQSLENIVLDLAHELVHATTRPVWDPYDPKLTPGKYIFAAIEGEGGEVEAVIAECEVALQLSNYITSALSRCRGYLRSQATSEERTSKKTASAIDPAKVRADFYRVGKWLDEVNEKLGKETALFPLLTEEKPKLFSSTGHTPYPIALYREFQEITEIACDNTRKRHKDGDGRSPASENPRAGQDDRATSLFLATRCHPE
jgi:hypothetical protein